MARDTDVRSIDLGDATKAREAELLSLMGELRPRRDAVEAAQAALKKARDDEAVVRNKAGVLGFTMSIIDKALKYERQPTNRKGQQKDADEEYFVFSTLGLPVSRPQGTLDFGSDEERDEAYWGDQGFQAGIRGDRATPPDECPPHIHQVWLNRRAAGVEYSAWGKSAAGGKPDQGRREAAGANTPSPPAAGRTRAERKAAGDGAPPAPVDGVTADPLLQR